MQRRERFIGTFETVRKPIHVMWVTVWQGVRRYVLDPRSGAVFPSGYRSGFRRELLLGLCMVRMAADTATQGLMCLRFGVVAGRGDPDA